MRVRLAYKLFLTFLITSVVSIVLMVGIMRYFVERDFREFVNREEMERLGELVEKLGQVYQEHQGWGFLKADPGAFREIVRPDFRRIERPFPEPRDPGGRPDMGFGPDREVPPPSLPAHPYIPHMDGRISLFDEQERVVAGRSDTPEGHIMRAITVDGRTVGWLGLLKRKEPSGPLEARFLSRMTLVFSLTGCATLVLAALVSYLLSRHLLRPVGQIAQGAHALASRKFDTRIAVDTADELGELAEDFNRMAQTLDRYETLRKQWISDISHELRTPLAILRGEIESIQDGVRGVTAKSLESLHAEVMHLEKLVRDLHDLSVADAGSLSIIREPVDVLDVLEETLDLFATRFTQAALSFSYDRAVRIRPVVMGDRDRLAQVFSNIFENTLRYTESPGEMRIWWELSENAVRLNFEDSKPGVPDSSLDKLFDRLYRIDPSRSRRNGGSGLGLAICKSIVESSGGEIHAAHSTLGGLRIEMTLPLLRKA